MIHPNASPFDKLLAARAPRAFCYVHLSFL
jgi:hypothetical protein